MAHPLHHAQSSMHRYGGQAEDYQAIHDWFDATKSFLATPQHRALRHHTAGIFEAERIFGISLTNSEGREIPVRFIAEQHIREDCRCIPTVSDWLRHIPIEPWMANGVLLQPDHLTDADLREAWMAAVSRGDTILGFQDWHAEKLAQAKAREAFDPEEPRPGVAPADA